MARWDRCDPEPGVDRYPMRPDRPPTSPAAVVPSSRRQLIRPAAVVPYSPDVS